MFSAFPITGSWLSDMPHWVLMFAIYLVGVGRIDNGQWINTNIKDIDQKRSAKTPILS